MADLEKQKEKYNKSKFYESSGEKVERKAKFCPKCGPGVFMAEHNDRSTCGACGFTDMKGRAAEAPKEKPAEEKPKEAPKEEKKEEAPTEGAQQGKEEPKEEKPSEEPKENKPAEGKAEEEPKQEEKKE